MNRRELVQATAAHGDLDAKMVDRAIKAMTEVITSVNAKGEPVAISGFAKFARVDRAARMARNPATGAPVKVKASKKAKITALKGYKDGVMSISAAPKLAKGVWPPAPPAKKAASTAKAAPAKKSASTAKAAPAKKAASAPAKKTAAAKTSRSSTARKR
ncbi:MAG: DNA-binding protein HU-beta [Acidimicrobiaceae bacterium]